MARGIEINGMLRGKRGGVVYYRSNGQQMSRPRVTEVKNPKTAKQAVQRMVLATASKITASLRPIVDHSFESVKVGETSVRLFQSRTMNALRNAAAWVINGAHEGAPVCNFALKGAPIAGCLEAMYISSGRLAMNGYEAGENVVNIVLSAPLSRAIRNENEYAEELAKLGIKPGDQVTYVIYSMNNDLKVATFESEVNVADMWRFCRVVFKSDVSGVDFTASPTLIVDGAINPVFIEESYGQLPVFSSEDAENPVLRANFTTIQESGFNLAACAVIRSQKQENGAFFYSAASLKANRTEFDENKASGVFPSYMNNATPVKVGDMLYLRHAIAAPFSQGE